MSQQYHSIFYRPEWTCGRFNQKANVALFYNLIDGMAYFFEGYSAQVIGSLLSLDRNEGVELQLLSDRTGISENCLLSFLNTLMDIGLLTSKCPTKDDIRQYRLSKTNKKRNENPKISDNSRDDYPVEMNDAELAYKEKVDGVVSVMLELTYNCSEKCIHCYNIGATRNDNEQSSRNIEGALSLTDYKRIIDELYSEGVVKICLSGGDPFSNPYVWKILDYLYEKGIATDIFTNGQSIVNQVERVAKYYPRLIGISLYSGVASDHDRITRIKSSFHKTVSVIEQFAELSVPMVLKCCVMRTNVKSYRKVSDIANEYGIPVQYELNVTDSVEGDKCVSHYLRLSSDILEIVLRDPNTIMYVGKELQDYGGVEVDMHHNSCKAGYGSFCVTPNGELIPCCAFHLSFGNLKKQHLHDILMGSKLLKEWRVLTVADYEECGKYDFCKFCNLCAGLNYSEHGTPLKSSENNCYMAKVRYRLADKISKQGYDPLNGMTLDEKLHSLPDINIGSIHRVFN